MAFWLGFTSAQNFFMSALQAFYWNQISADRIRVAEIAALVEDRPPPPPDPNMSAFAAAAMHDPDVLRALIECVVCVSVPHEAMWRPHVAAKIAEFKGSPPAPEPGMSRS